MLSNDNDRDLPGDDFRDDDLRARFAVLRKVEEAQAPEFSIPARRGADHGRRRRAGKLIAVAACLVTIVTVVIWLRVVSPKPDGNRVASITEWKAPTDFLLETPGRDMLRTVPAIGEWHDYTQVSKPGKERPQLRKQNSP